MKCMPTTLCGRVVTAARRVIGIELVLVASTAPGPAASSRLRKRRSLRATSSVAASMARSAATGSFAGTIRLRAPSAASASTVPFSTSLLSERSMPARARSSWAWETSTSVTS